MALGTPVAAAAAYSAASGTTVTPAYPTGILTTDVVLLFVGQKPSTANGGTVTTPTGWTLREEITGAGGYGATLGADTGNTNLRIYSWNSPVAGQTGNLSVTLGANNVSWAFILRVPSTRPIGSTITFGSADGQRTTTPTSPLSVALTNGTSATNFKAGDLAIWAMCIPTDVTTPAQFSAQGITATGATFGTVTEINEPDSGNGNDIGGFSARALVTSGNSSTAPTITATLAGTLTNVRGPVALIRIRETAVLIGDGQTYDETLQPATLTVDRTITASSNTFAFNGNDVTLTKSTPPKILTADVATFTEDLKPANLNVSRTLFCAVATFTEDLKPANLNVSRTLFCAVATYTVQGTETNFNRGVSLTADSQPYTFIGRDATLFPSRYLSLARTTFTITGPPASLIAIADTHTVTIDPPAGWALHLVTDVSQAGISACIYYNLSPAVAVGDQILYRTTTETNSNAVSVSSTGIVSTVPSGSDTLKFRHWRPSTWSAELTFTVSITARTLTADTQTYTEDLQPANLSLSRKLIVATGFFGLTTNSFSNIFTDNFNRADSSSLGANWQVNQNTFRIVSNQVRGSTTYNQTSLANVVSGTYNSDQFAQIDVIDGAGDLDGFDVIGPGVRVNGKAGYYLTLSRGDTLLISIYKIDSSGVVISLSDKFLEITASIVTAKLSVTGNKLSAYLNNDLVETVIDNTYSSGVPGLYYRTFPTGVTSADNFIAGNTVDNANLKVSRTLSCDSATYALDGKVTALPVKKIRYVNTTSTSGGTGRTNATTGADRAYATLRSALETEQADLIAQNVKLEIYCAGGADSSTSSQQNWPSMVTGPNNDIKIYAAPGNEAEESFNSNKYHIARFTGGQEAINLGTTDNLYISYYNLQIKSTLTTHVAFRIGATTSGTTTGKVVISGCYIEGGTTAYGTSFNSRNQPHVVVNSILVTTGGAASNTIASVFYNNTVISYSTAAAAAPQPGSTIPYYMRNNIFQNYGGGVALSGTLPTNTSSNITNDATSPEVGLRNITLIFRDKVGKNYRLISEDSAGIGSGTNLSADPIYPITVDLLGSTRTTWDIGAVKYVPLISLSSSVYLLNTSETSLTASRTLSCDPATYAEDLQPANLTLQRKISSNVGYFRLLTVARQTNFSDNFNRADESLDASANWQRADIEVGSLSIINNRVSGGANIGNVYSGALADDQWAEFTFSGIAPSGTSKGAAVLLRATGGTSSFTGYVVSLERSNTEPGTDLVRIRYCLNVATFTNAFSLGTLLASYRVPDFANNTSGAVVLRAEVVGSIITAYINGSPCLFVSDSQSTSGKVGIWTDSANIDDFNSGSFTDTLFLKANRTLSCDPATYTLELKDATLTKVSAKVLTADSQTYNEDLQPANLKAARTLLATTQTYNEDLQPANLRIAKRLVADSQIYTFTGRDVSFSSAEVFGTISREYTLSGNNVLFLRSAISSSVAYTFTGRDANLFRGERLTAESRAYNLTGRDASLNHTARLTADTSTYTLTGRDANLLRGERLTADTSTYTFTGRDASLLRAERVTADVSSYSLSGQSANLLKNTRLVSDVQSYAFSGIDAIFRAARRLPAEEFRANYIRNSMMVGTIAGTPGTAPNLWATFVPTWCTRTIVGTGIDSTTGLTYIDVALSGTNSSGATSSILLDPINSTTAPAGAGQTWVSSAYFGLLVGSWPTSAVSIGTVSRDSLGSGTGNQYISIKGVSGSSLQRVSATYTIVSSSARYIQTVIRFDLLANDSLNLTIRIAAPQLERGSVARTFIPTTNAVQYRWFELAGQSANLLENRRLVAESSSYTLTRNDANLSVTRKLVADSSSYALTGNNVLFVTTGSLNVTTATFTLTGNSANFARSRILVAATQPYNFVPNDAILKTSKKVIADKATYTLTGRAANLAAGEISTSDSQSFILTGNSVRFNRSVKSIVSSYTLTASDTSLKVGRKISLTVSSYITSGIATNLLANKKILAVRVFFDTNGYVDPGYTDPNYVSIDAGIISSRLIIGQTITYNLNGNTVIIVRGGFIKVWTGSAWVSKPLKVWDGTAWVSKPLKVWTGSTWRTY